MAVELGLLFNLHVYNALTYHYYIIIIFLMPGGTRKPFGKSKGNNLKMQIYSRVIQTRIMLHNLIALLFYRRGEN